MPEFPSDAPAWLTEAVTDLDRNARANLSNPNFSSDRAAGYFQCLERLLGLIQDRVDEEEAEKEESRRKFIEAQRTS